MILTTVLQAIGLFMATNIDDIIILSLFFARGAGQRGTTTRIALGQYLGFVGILGAALLVAWGAGLVDFSIRPHLGSDDFPMAGMAMMERAAARFGGPLYALDDASAIKVDGDRVEVVSESTWKLLNPG